MLRIISYKNIFVIPVGITEISLGDTLWMAT